MVQLIIFDGAVDKTQPKYDVTFKSSVVLWCKYESPICGKGVVSATFSELITISVAFLTMAW